jgi:A/G-specific adenine glycosylase
VPADHADLLALPGVGDYTAAAIAVFAHRRRHAVLDTNVRRVHARVLDGVEHPPASVTRAERERAAALLPADDADAATWSVAVMELGALVCTAQRPRCGSCPVATRCSWRAAGHPAYAGPPRRAQAWAGTDRQCRGRLLGVVRDAHGAVPRHRLEQEWSEPTQRERCLESLVADGLLVATAEGFALP